MADGARVEDIETLKEFDTYLARFREDLIGTCDALSFEFQRVQSWLHEEVLAYWKNELRRSEDRLHEARQALMVCQNKSRAEDYEACSEQLKQFEKAKARLRLCEEKLSRLRACQMQWEQFANQAKPRIAQAAELADTSIPRGKAELSQILDLLEKYRTN